MSDDRPAMLIGIGRPRKGLVAPRSAVRSLSAPWRLWIRQAEEGKLGEEVVVRFEAVEVTSPWVRKAMRAEKTSSVRLRPLG